MLALAGNYTAKVAILTLFRSFIAQKWAQCLHLESEHDFTGS